MFTAYAHQPFCESFTTPQSHSMQSSCQSPAAADTAMARDVKFQYSFTLSLVRAPTPCYVILVHLLKASCSLMLSYYSYHPAFLRYLHHYPIPAFLCYFLLYAARRLRYNTSLLSLLGRHSSTLYRGCAKVGARIRMRLVSLSHTAVHLVQTRHFDPSFMRLVWVCRIYTILFNHPRTRPLSGYTFRTPCPVQAQPGA